MIFEDLPAESQDLLVRQLTQFMAQLSHLSFPAICSIALPPLPTEPPSLALLPLCPLTHRCFYVEGRTALLIDRGPFPTVRAYFLACAERERATTRALFAQGTPVGAEC